MKAIARQKVIKTSIALHFPEMLNYSDTTANVYAAISSVILLHVLLALFIIKAFKEYPAKGVKQD